MERQSVKRSSNRRFSDLFSPSASSQLQSALNDLEQSSRLTVKMAESNQRAGQKLMEWAHTGHNAALEDVTRHTNELLQLFAQSQLEFAKEFQGDLEQLDKMKDCEERVRKAMRKVRNLETKEKTLKMEMNKPIRFWRKGGDLRLLKQRQMDTAKERQLAEKELKEEQAEMEVVKMFRFRNGMKGISDAYTRLSNNSAAIFNCHREITEHVPGISTQDIRTMVYSGSQSTQQCMDQLKHQLELESIQSVTQRRRSEPIQQQHKPTDQLHYSPPPPYSVIPTNQLGALRISQPNRSRRSNHLVTSSSSNAIPTQSGHLYPALDRNPYQRS